MKYRMLLISLVFAAQACGQSPTSPKGDPPMAEYAKPFFVEDIAKATDHFAKAKLDKEQFDDLAEFLHTHPSRYAAIMAEFTKRLRTGKRDGVVNNSEWTDYLHRRTKESEAFAAKSAVSWKKGWNMTTEQVVPKLGIKDFPSTRRIAIEFLKHETGGDDFGYRWQDKPESAQNRRAILKWKAWFDHQRRA